MSSLYLLSNIPIFKPASIEAMVFCHLGNSFYKPIQQECLVPHKGLKTSLIRPLWLYNELISQVELQPHHSHLSVELGTVWWRVIASKLIF